MRCPGRNDGEGGRNRPGERGSDGDIFQQLYSLPVWLIAGSVTLIASIVFAVFLFVVLAVSSEQQRREDMLEREPWRRHVRPERRFDPDPR